MAVAITGTDVSRRSLCHIDGVGIAESIRWRVLQTDRVSNARGGICGIYIEKNGFRDVTISNAALISAHLAIGAIDHARLPGTPRKILLKMLVTRGEEHGGHDGD